MPMVSIPQSMLREHVNWHTRVGNPAQGGRAIPQGQPGSGKEFLNWHHGFISRYKLWRKQNGEPTINVWSKIPSKLNPIPPNLNPPNVMAFNTLDKFGIFLEDGVHVLLHNRAAIVYNEPVLTTFESPRSSYFWKLHGLIDKWRKEWLKAH